MFSADHVQVTARTDWFAKPDRREFEPGSTLAEILHCCGVPADLQPFYDVTINGHQIEPALRHLIKPKTGTVLTPVVVTIHPQPLRGGNKGTAKNVITIVATLALVAGTAFIGAGGLVALGASSALFGAGTAGAALAAAAFGIAGQLALQALAPPPLAANNKTSGKVDTVAGITGNPVQPFEYLPLVLGTCKVSPPFVAQPYSLLEDEVVTVRAVVGLAGNNLIEDVLINGVAADEFPGVEYETADGSSTTPDLTLVTQCGFEQAGEVLSEFDLGLDGSSNLQRLADQSTPDNSTPQYHYFQTVGTPYEAHLRLGFPAGLYNSTLRAGVAFRVEYKLASSSTWLKGPEIHMSPVEAFSKPFRQRIKFKWTSIPGSAVPSSSSRKTFYAYGYTGANSWNWSASSQFKNGSLKPAKNVVIDRDGITLYMGTAAGKYDIRIRRSMAYQFTKFNQTSYEWDGAANKAAFFDYYNNSGNYDIRLNQSDYVGTVQVEAFTTIKNTHPIADKSNLALIAVKAQKVKIDSISATFTSRARTFNGVTWNSTYAETDNPAALFREVLLGDLNARPLDAAVVDDFELGLAYQDCVSNGYRCAGVIQGYSVEQALQAIAAVAYGVPRQEEKWSILLERDVSSDSPVQIFSPRNYAGLTIEKSFDPVPHALRAIYRDEDNDQRSAEVIVYHPDYNSSTATLFQSIDYVLFPDEAAVEARATFDLRQLLYRKTRYVVDLDWTHLVSGRGALVGLDTDELSTASGSAHITSILRSGGNIVAFYLDAPVSTPASFAGAVVQYADGTTTTRQISEVTDSQYIEFVTPFADPGSDVLVVGMPVVVGPYSEVVKRCKIFDIERLGDLQARVTLLDEAPEIYA